jgi:hypothetical protein
MDPKSNSTENLMMGQTFLIVMLKALLSISTQTLPP